MSWHVYIHFKTQVNQQKDHVQNSKIRNELSPKSHRQKFPPLQLVCACTNLALSLSASSPTKIPKHLPHLILIWVTNLPNIPSLQCLNSCIEYRFLLIHATYALTSIIHLNTWFKWREKYIDGWLLEIFFCFCKIHLNPFFLFGHQED